MNEGTLTENIALCQPTYLPFANHVHGLVACDRVYRPLNGTKPETGRDALLDESVILLHYVVQVRTAATIARLAQLSMGRFGRTSSEIPVDSNRLNLLGRGIRGTREEYGRRNAVVSEDNLATRAFACDRDLLTHCAVGEAPAETHRSVT